MDLIDIKQFIQDNNVPAFHGIEALDAFKYLSEMESLPKFVRNDYARRYEAKVYELGSSDNWNLGKQLYEHFNGNGDIKILRTLDEEHYANVTVKALEIEIPYFAKMDKYLSKNPHVTSNFNRGNSVRSVLDIVIDDVSLFDILIKKPFLKEGRSAHIDMFYLINDRDYAILNGFTKPYNGICSSRIPEIFRSIIKERDSNTKSVSYITGLVNDLRYFTATKAEFIQPKDYRSLGTLKFVKE